MTAQHTPPSRVAARVARGRDAFHSRPVLLIAFAFAVMADPVSSVAYAIEAALRALHGNLGLLLPAMGLVVAIIALVITNYHQLVARFPEGGGAAAAAGRAFGEGWAFVPIGALDRRLRADDRDQRSGRGLGDDRLRPGARVGADPARAAVAVVRRRADLVWASRAGDLRVMTLAFVAAGVAVLVGGLSAPVANVGRVTHSSGHPAGIAVLLAFPVAMALATGVEAPSSAIAQLGQLDNAGRRRFGRVTLWLTLGIVGTLTLGLTAAAVRLKVGIPAANSTQIGNLAKASVSHGLFAFFQLATALLLLAAASSSFQAGPGLLKALARRRVAEDEHVGILPAWMGRTNEHHTPYWSVVVFLVISALVTAVLGANDQELVLYYAVSVFMSFLVGLLAMARFSQQERNLGSLVLNAIGALVVAFTLAVNLARGHPIISVAAALLIGLALHRLWSRAGRPRGIASVLIEAERAD